MLEGSIERIEDGRATLRLETGETATLPVSLLGNAASGDLVYLKVSLKPEPSELEKQHDLLRRLLHAEAS